MKEMGRIPKHVMPISHSEFVMTGYVGFNKFVELMYNNMIFWMPVRDFSNIVFEEWRGYKWIT
jgi:hypothetical protein